MNQEVDEYEASKLTVQEGEVYRLPAWYRRSFIWLWPYILIGIFAYNVAPAADRGGIVIWWVGILLWCAVFFSFFRRLE